MHHAPLPKSLRLGLAISIWLLGLASLLLLGVGWGGNIIELFKGMNLKLPLVTQIFLAITAPFRIKGLSLILSVVWTVGAGFLWVRSQDMDSLVFVATIILIFALCQVGFLLSVFAAGLPLYQLMGNLG